MIIKKPTENSISKYKDCGSVRAEDVINTQPKFFIFLPQSLNLKNQERQRIF
jgi:hypothetical protein